VVVVSVDIIVESTLNPPSALPSLSALSPAVVVAFVIVVASAKA
jgi:hypothetical protein